MSKKTTPTKNESTETVEEVLTPSTETAPQELVPVPSTETVEEVLTPSTETEPTPEELAPVPSTKNEWTPSIECLSATEKELIFKIEGKKYALNALLHIIVPGIGEFRADQLGILLPNTEKALLHLHENGSYLKEVL